MIIELYHQFSHDIGLNFFDSGNVWLHGIAHVVIFGSPTIVIYFLLVKSFRLARQLIGRFQSFAATRSGTQPGVYTFILKYSASEQIKMIILAAISMPLLYMIMDLPKQIINNALKEGHKETEAFHGFMLTQEQHLLILCFAFICIVMSSGAVKFYLNTRKGIIAERMTRRLRLTIFSRWRKSGRKNLPQILPLISQEVEPVGGFSADAFVLPLFEGGTFLTIFLFIAIQNPILGLSAIVLLPVQLVLIPRLQKRINKLGRDRVIHVRNLNKAISDSSSEKSDHLIVHESFRKMQNIRTEIFIRKYTLKSVSNFINHLTPFFFYTIGGFLVIKGSLSFGSLVAVLAVYKDLSDPLKELFGYYQNSEDVRVRYEEIFNFIGS